MPDTIIESVLTEKLDATLLLKWLNNESLEDTPDDCILNCCNRNEFVTCFLSYLRNQTDSILQTNSNAVQILQHSTPEKLLSTRRKHRRSISDPTSEDRTMDSLTVKSDRQRSHESPSKDRKRTGRRVKTKLFTDEKSINQSVSSDESRLSTGVDRITLTSTPMKNGMNPHDYPNLPLTSPVTPRSFVKDQYERCDTPRLSHRHSRSQEKSCLGDYMVIAQKSSKKKKGRSSTDNEESKQELDLTNSEMFPEIGARKASSLRSDKRRIKPTNIDKSEKSVSLNSFSMESIHTSPLHVEENSAFKHQRVQIKESNNFEVERNILKQERHKLMEKFNILNTSLPQKPMPTPQIKITQKKVVKTQNYIKSDVTKIVFKEKLDLLVDIYESLLRNNLIMSLNTEIYFLISILISKQFEEDYILAESKLTVSDMGFLLKTIHNSTYFAVKSLWHQRVILEVILDKSSLKTLGENKKIRSFYPDLAKFLLNCYGLRCEAETNQDRSRQTETRSNGVICFNFETDNADNFPSMLSFQNFKKQRDMFYEILRWYQDSQTSGSSRSSLRARVKALLACSTSPSNHRHLASLFTLHMLAHCLPTSAQESKLSKLQRRLTCPNAPESHRLPHFTEQETFYKEFIINAENEAFRAHLRDSIANEITALDSTHIATDDRGNYNADVTNQYLSLSKKLALLSKFLGLLASLPYTQVVSDLSSKIPKIVHKENNYAPPKEKVLENDLTLRNYSQPTMDLKGILANAIEAGRLSITIPWIVHYLSMLDYTSLRIKYYQNLLKILFDVYSNRLKLENSNLKKNTIIYLKSMLGWLFDLPHFPHESFYENRLSNSVGVDMNIDSCDIIDESVIIELCPHLRDLNVLLSTCRVSQEQKEMGSYRHITPVSLILNPEDRIKNKEKELQARLEEELLKSQPSSTRRVLELVIERVTSACVRELSGHILTEHRQRASRLAARLVATSQLDQCALLTAVQQVYSSQLSALVSAARTAGRASLRARARGAVSALLSAAPPPLVALVLRAATTRLDKWLTDNWNTTAVLSKDIEAEMKTFLALGELATATTHKTTVDVTAMTSPDHVFFATNVSPASCIINLKEQLCQLLSGEECNTSQLYSVLSSCALACSASNVFGRPPTHRAILQLSVDLCVVFVSRKPEEVTDSFLSSLHAIWNVCCPDRKRSPPQEVMLPERREELSPEFRNFDDDEQVKTPISDDETKPTKIIILLPDKTEKPQEKSEKSIQEKESDECDLNLDFFNRILCPRNIMLLSAGNSVAWEAMGTVLVFLLTNDYLSEDSLTEQCLAVYRQDWSQNVLESLSTCMKSVSARWSRSSTGKFTLFLDFLAEYCGDMDYEPME